MIDGREKKMDKELNVGLYNYKILDVESINRIYKRIEDTISISNVYPYFENTTNFLKIDERKAFERLLGDYDISYIDIIVFKNILALGKSETIQVNFLKLLLEKNIHFIFLDENIDSRDESGKLFIEMKIIMLQSYLEELRKTLESRKKFKNKNKK